MKGVSHLPLFLYIKHMKNSFVVRETTGEGIHIQVIVQVVRSM